MKRAIRVAFPKTVPVMAGYLFLGIAFGILLQSNGYGVLWAFAMSTFIFAGSAQFLGVALLAQHASFLHTAVLVFILNFRHFFYGLSMISKYRGVGGIKAYLLFGLTDETYAILAGGTVPEGVNEKDYYLAVTLMDQIYWVTGSVLGAALGDFLKIDLTGIDFAMTALFAILVVEQWKAQKSHIPAFIGFLISLVALLILGPDNYLIPALIIISVLLLIIKEKIDLQGE